MLDLSEFSLLNRHILEPSFGKGAFLESIIKRYIEEFLAKNKDKEMLKNHLETYIHGVEIDKKCFESTLISLDNLVKKYGICNVKWDLKCDDMLSAYKNLPKMGLIIGNPPYVRIHNIKDTKFKNFHFASSGMADLYLVFFEIAFNLLEKNGEIIFITPNSWFNSLAARNMRKFISTQKSLKNLIDLGHLQVFKNITSYCSISHFSGENELINILDLNLKAINSIESSISFKGKNLTLCINENLSPTICKIKAKNGYATLGDKIFIGEFNFKQTIPIYKASRGKFSRCIFPYKDDLTPLDLEQIQNIDSKLFSYLKDNEAALKKRDIRDSNWWLFGRTQGLNDTFKPKIAFNTIIKNLDSIKIAKLPSGCGVYSGLYIVGDYELKIIESIIKTNEFLDYIYSLKKYKNGGYYTFSSSDLSAYLSDKLDIFLRI